MTGTIAIIEPGAIVAGPDRAPTRRNPSLAEISNMLTEHEVERRVHWILRRLAIEETRLLLVYAHRLPKKGLPLQRIFQRLCILRLRRILGELARKRVEPPEELVRWQKAFLLEKSKRQVGGEHRSIDVGDLVLHEDAKERVAHFAQ